MLKCSGPEHFCTPQPLLWGDAEHVATSIQILYNKIKILQVRQNSDRTRSPYHSIKKKLGSVASAMQGSLQYKLNLVC